MTAPLGRAAAALLTSALLATSLAACGSNDSSPSPVPAAHADTVGDVLPAKVVTYDALTAGAWVLTDVDGAGTSLGELQLNNADGAEAKINWRRATQYDSYVEDRSDLGKDRPLSVLGRDGRMWTYSAHDHTVIRPVDGAAFLEVRVDGVDETTFESFVASLGAVTPEQWSAAAKAAGLG